MQISTPYSEFQRLALSLQEAVNNFLNMLCKFHFFKPNSAKKRN